MNLFQNFITLYLTITNTKFFTNKNISIFITKIFPSVANGESVLIFFLRKKINKIRNSMSPPCKEFVFFIIFQECLHIRKVSQTRMSMCLISYPIQPILPNVDLFRTVKCRAWRSH